MKRAKTTRGQKVGLEVAHILDVALKLLAQKGYAGTSFQLIANQLKVSQSAVMYHFKSKALLLTALADKVVSSNHEYVSRLMRPEDSAPERLKKHFYGNLDWAADQPDEAQLLLMLYYLAAHDKPFRALYRKILDRARVRVLENVLAAQREGYSLNLPNPEITARVLHDGLLGGIVNYVAAASPDKAAVKELKTRWGFLLSIYFTK
jgi:AcrR family transcriptional regulator